MQLLPSVLILVIVSLVQIEKYQQAGHAQLHLLLPHASILDRLQQVRVSATMAEKAEHALQVRRCGGLSQSTTP